MTSFFETYVQPAADFAAQHPLLGSFVVFLLALGESVPVVGVVAPGTSVILAISALAGLGYLPLWAVLASAVLGAVAGDGLSYWFGYRYREHALGIWPISGYPELIAKSEQFFSRHGGKSIAIARFTPVVRAFVPLIAGVSGMKAARFYAANVTSAFAWAFSHFLPAAAFGASIGILHQISARLVVLLAFVIAGAVLLVVGMRLALRWGNPVLVAAHRRAQLALDGRQGRLAGILRNLIQPEDGSAREVAFLGIIIAGGLVLLFNLVEDVIARGELMRSDQAISTLLSGWRTVWGDSLMVAVTALGDMPVTALVAAAAVGWIFWKGQRKLGLGFIVAIGVTGLFVVVLKSTMQVPRPTAIYTGIHAFSFPSGHASFAAVLYGILGWIWWRGLLPPWRTAAIAGTALLVSGIAFSRVYLQAHWSSDVAAGLVFGICITAVFALAFRSTRLKEINPAKLLGVAVLVLVGVGGWHASMIHAAGLKMYARQTSTVVTTGASWRRQDWRKLPANRIDLGGQSEEPIVLQWAGPSKNLVIALSRHGWTAAVPINQETAGRYLQGTTTASDVPVLPRLHDGQTPVMSLVRIAPDGINRDIFHLWASRLVLSDANDAPVLVGALVRDRIEHPLPFLSVPSDLEIPAAGIANELLTQLPNATLRSRQTPSGSSAATVVLAGA